MSDFAEAVRMGGVRTAKGGAEPLDERKAWSEAPAFRVSLLLYSTNCFLKYLVQRTYRHDKHYVWCSEFFDSNDAAPRSLASLVPASSSPAEIYSRLRNDVKTKDQHSAKIAEQGASIKRLAVKWHKASEISLEEKEEITCLVKKATFEDWRPLIYIIPRGPVGERAKTVAVKKRAGLGREYIVSDLDGSEFHVIEP
jgi:hypothetical protein